jgi:Domain of unknown function (DUF4386)
MAVVRSAPGGLVHRLEGTARAEPDTAHMGELTMNPDTREGTRVGSRLVLVGAVLYFLEWVAIIGTGGMPVLFDPGTDPGRVLHGYVGHSNAYAWAAGWFGVVLLGRALFAVGLRHGLVRSGFDHPAAEFGVLAMAAGAVIEIVSYGIAAGAGILADHGGDAHLVTALDATARSVNILLWGATGLGVLCLSWAMLRSALFPRVLAGLGLLGGAVMTLSGLAFGAPEYASAQAALQAAGFAMWIWMIWSGVLMWRAGPRA